MLKEKIESGKTYLGIELGSSRIKASLIDDTFVPIAGGSFDWENCFEHGYWTYSLESIQEGVTSCFQNLSENVLKEYGVRLHTVGAIGVSAMMHGYLAFDAQDQLLIPFRTWRNTTTSEAAKQLTELFHFNIPQRWSISHLYQAILNHEAHVPHIAHITTLAGYIHFLLTGRREVGIGDASGVFPINGKDYDKEMLLKFKNLMVNKNYNWDIGEILPKVKLAGERGAVLSKEGARFLDPTGALKAGIPICPPEGDAGTGMVATNAVLPKTGNISAGTSIFSMLVLEKPLNNLYPQIDIVTTPEGLPVAMVHCNNCCSELDTWVSMFGEFAALLGNSIDKSRLYEILYRNAMSGDCDCKGITAYNYLSGEHVTNITNGRPMYFRLPDSKMNLANFIKAQLYASVATLKIGMDVLFKQENVNAESFFAHGGLLKIPQVAQQILANALNTPVSVMETAGEGGAWGMALLAAFMMNQSNKSLGEWMADEVFNNLKTKTLQPEEKGVLGFEGYIKRYKAGLSAERQLEEVT